MDSWAGFKSHVTHLECSATGERYAAGEPHNLSKAGKPLAGALRPASGGALRQSR